MRLLHLLSLLSLLSLAHALRFSHNLPSRKTFNPAALRSRALFLQEVDPPTEPPAKPQAEAGGYRTVYDDEAPPQERDPLSASMRERLIKEQRGLGADPNSSNPFLYVFAGVGVFVVLGALAVNI